MLDSIHFTFEVPLNEIKVELCQKISFCVYSNLFVNFRDQKISLFFHYDSYWKVSNIKYAHLSLFFPH